jgi:hypothetical protein
MAVDDAFIVISANQSGGQATDRQPSAGVEEIVTAYGMAGLEGSSPNQTPPSIQFCVDGTNIGAIWSNGNSGGGARVWGRDRLGSTNTNYFRIQNSGSTGDVGFSGIQQG